GRCRQMGREGRSSRDVSREGQRHLRSGHGAGRRDGARLGAWSGTDARLWFGRLRNARIRIASRADGSQGEGAPAGRRARHRVAGRRRSRADDGAGRGRGRIRPRRRAVRSRVVSGGEAPADGPLKTGRVDAVDCARGLALVGMAAYHLTWDLADFRVVSPMLPFSPPMRLVSHVVGSAFLALVGVSLGLAHRDRMNLPAFWRRLALVAGAAALVTAASLVFAPGQAIWFGILHCIAVASLVALPFVEAPAWASLLAGAAAIALPFFVHSTLFDPSALLWLGLGEALPNTLDWYPLLPWAGVVIIGLGFARLPGVLPRLTSP